VKAKEGKLYGKQNIYPGKVDVNLESVNEGEKHSGNPIF
jgi:hypothetical protein